MTILSRASAGLVSALLASSVMVVHVAAHAGAATGAATGALDASDERRPPQMTQKEYRKIRDGMTQDQVRRIVGSRGAIDTRDDNCIIRRYTSGRPAIDPHYRVTWVLQDGRFQVYDKSAPGGFPFCPSGSRGAASATSDVTDVAVGGAQRRAPQMTDREYRRIRLGMSPAQVRRIVGSKGRLDVDTGRCIQRSYSSNQPFEDARYRVVWTRDDGTYAVYSKSSPQGFAFCPGEV